MGSGFFKKLFGSRQSKDNSSQNDLLDVEIEKVYNNTKADARELLYYGGVDSAKIILKDLSSCISEKPDTSTIDLCHQMYIQTWVRCRGGFNPAFSTPQYIRDAMCKRFPAVESKRVIDFVNKSLGIIYQHEPQLEQKAAAFDFLSQSVGEKSGANKDLQDKIISDPEYGLVPEKPVFVAGFGKDKEYLEHLSSETGEKLTYIRNGSMTIRGIRGPVDSYSLFLPDNTEYMKIYLCVYGTRNTRDVPSGLCYTES